MATTFVLLDPPRAQDQGEAQAAGSEEGRLMMRGWSLHRRSRSLPLVACAESASAPACRCRRREDGGQTAARPAEAPATRANGATTAPRRPPDPAEAPVKRTRTRGEGRRDPFTNLLNTGAVAPRPRQRAAKGRPDCVVNEIVVRAVVEGRAKTVALIQGPDGRSYNIHAGDKLMDGTVKVDYPAGSRHHAGRERSAVDREAAGGSQAVAFAGGSQAVTSTKALTLSVTLAVAAALGGVSGFAAGGAPARRFA